MTGPEFAAARVTGDIRVLARTLTIAENDPPAAYRVLRDAGSGTAGAAVHVLGITGPPGVGKSTLVNAIVTELRERRETVAVLAVDPSSPFRGGALLGDRIRMVEHGTDPGVYIRSMATRGNLGGLTRAAWLAVRTLESWQFDWIIVETAGVGQNEIDIVDLADTTALVLSPAAGDDVQVMKAGIMEAADMFVINKCDLPGADRVRNSLASILPMDPVICETVANAPRSERGMDQVIRAIESRRTGGKADRVRRIREEVRRAALDLLNLRVLDAVVDLPVGSREAFADPAEIARSVLNDLKEIPMKHIDHLGIAVTNLDAAIPRWQALGFELSEIEAVPDQKVRVAMFPAGESRMELLESTDPDGPIARFISKRGEGIHHIAYVVEDIEHELTMLKERGIRLIDETPRVGAGGALIAFVHPSETGVLIELCERHTDHDK